ncbi:MAG TPA: BamA/TamA family outer membrane protein [Candidatus Kapabacteria bacterium]|nr:BamA/TamA family outer membrane protein [Candidatus Kapabacteria bacterium]
MGDVSRSRRSARSRLPHPLQLFPKLLFIVLLVAVAGPSFGQSFIELEKNRKREIVDVRFEGNRSLSTPELQSIVATQAPSWLSGLSFLSSSLGPQLVDPEVQGEDTVRLFVYYRNRGFLDAHVSCAYRDVPSTVEAWQNVVKHNALLAANEKSKLPNIQDTVIFRVSEGTPYTINFFSFSGLENLPSDLLQQVNKETVLKKGTTYSADKFNQERLRVETILRENGYAFFTTPRDSQIVVKHPLTHTTDINMTFHTGPRVRNGMAHIYYDSAYQARGTVRPSVIMRQISLDSGAWFRYSDLAATERDLGRLGTFELYKVDLDTSGFAGHSDSIKEGTAVPVSIFLRMRSLAELTPGIFLGSGGIKGVVFGGSLALTHHSIFGGAENATIQTEYQPLPTSQLRWSLGGQLVFPYVGFKKVPLILSANFVTNELKNEYKEQIYEASVGSNILLSAPTIKPRVVLVPDISLEYVRRDISDTTFFMTTSILTKREQFNIPLSVNLSFDWSNDLLNPSAGSIVAYTTQFASPVLSKIFPTRLPSAAYWKNTLQLKTYMDASRNATSIFAFRLSGGVITLFSPEDTSRDISFERRFYGGGTNSLRAWGSRGILVSRDTLATRPQTGGYKSFEANIEWRYAPFQYYPAPFTAWESFFSDMRIAFFADAGNVWDRDVPITISTMALAAGAGIHYTTLFGVFRLDFGLKMYDPNPSSTSGLIPADASGKFLWNRGKFKFFDVCTVQLGFGQSF